MDLGELKELSNEELKRLEKRPIPERPEPDGTGISEGGASITLTGKIFLTAVMLAIPLITYGVIYYPVQTAWFLIVGIFILILCAIWGS